MLHHLTNKTRLKQVLEAAEETIDVCMFVMSCAVLLDTLVEGNIYWAIGSVHFIPLEKT